MPIGASVLLLCMTRAFTLEALPLRLCYAAFTFDIWALTTIFSEQKVQYGSVGGRGSPWPIVIFSLIVHLISVAACADAESRPIDSDLEKARKQLRVRSFVAWSLTVFSLFLVVLVRF
ncbi:MAG: hypothetical protein ACRD2L_23705 [Terriglobia bacterium]